MAFIIKAPQPRQQPAPRTMPETPERDDNAPVVIVGTVRAVRHWSVLLWDCPEQKWYSLANQAQADQMSEALINNLKVRATVRGTNIEGID